MPMPHIGSHKPLYILDRVNVALDVECLDREPIVRATLHGLLEHAIGAPIDIAEDLRMTRLHSDEIVAAIDTWTDDNVGHVES